MDTQASIFDLTADFVKYDPQQETAEQILGLIFDLLMPVGLGQVLSRAGNALAATFATYATSFNAAVATTRQISEMVNSLAYDAFRITETITGGDIPV